MADVFEFLQNLKEPVFKTPPITYGAPPPTIRVADPNNPLGKLSLPPLNQAPDLQTPVAPQKPVVDAGTPSAPTGSVTAPDDNKEDDDILSRFKPDTRAQDAYFDLLNHMPKPDENIPLGRRILAGLSTQGQGGLKRAEEIKQEGYLQRLGDFNRKASILKDLAASERSANVNDRLVMSQMLTDRRSARTAAETERHHKETEAAASRRAELSEFMARNPSYQLKVGENGNFVAFNPKDPTKPPIDTNVKSGEMSELARLMLMQNAQNQRQFTQADLDRQAEELRQQHRIELEKLQAQLKVQNEYNKPMTPTEIRIDRFNKAAQALNTDPENKKFISLGQPGTNDFELIIPPRAPWWLGGSAETKKNDLDRYENLAKSIYGPDWKKQFPDAAREIQNARGGGAGKSARSQPTPIKTTTTVTVKRPANVPATHIHVRDKETGQTGWIDPSQLGTKYEKID